MVKLLLVLALDQGARAELEALAVRTRDRRRIHGAVGHVDLDCLLDGLFDGQVVAEALPLSVHRVDAPAGKDVALLDEALPVDLVLVLARGVAGGHLEDLDELADCEPGSLP